MYSHDTHSFWNILVVGQLDQVEDRGRHEPMDIANKIENLEDQFNNLRTRIMNELSRPDITVQVLLNQLIGLPLSLRREYESSIAKRIPNMRTETQVNELFIIHLNPLTSFIDYGLIEYVIKKFGSDALKKDMRSYCSEIVIFMKETTIKQLIDHLPGQAEVPPKFSLIEAKIGENPSEYTLEQLNTIRKRYCSELRLSEIVFHLLALLDSNSFIIRWLVPSALVFDIMKSARTIDQSFYQECRITSLTLDGMWLFLSESEIDGMWSQANMTDTIFKTQFHTIYNQVMYELEIQGVSEHELWSCLMDQESLLSGDSSLPLIIFEMLTVIVEKLGSDCLKRVMKSYRNYVMSIDTRCLTAEQLIALSPFPSKPSKYFVIGECRIVEKASEYGLKRLASFQTRFCTVVNINRLGFVIGGINTEINNSFTVRWLVPSALVFDVLESTRNLDLSFFQEYKLSSVTLDGMWLFMSETKIDVMWSNLHVSDTKFKDQFHDMYKQIVEMVQKKGHELISSNITKTLKCDQSASDWLSVELLDRELPVSVIDFRVLAAAIEGFGSHCLKSVMSSYSKYMSTFLKESTAQQLINLSAIQLQHSEYSIIKCRIKEEPSQYKLDELFGFRTEFCTIADLSELCFIMDEVITEMSDSFTISWLVPPAFISNIMESSRNFDHSLYHRYNITSLTLDGLWLFLSEVEIDAIWSRLHVSDTKFKDQFHTMCKQIVCEIFQVQCVSKNHLSACFQSLNYQQQISDQFSLAVLEEEFPASFVDFRVLKAVIERFGSDCLKRVMESYCNYMSTIFTRESTAQQLMNLSAFQSKHWKHFVAAKCTVMEEPSCYRVKKLLQFQTKFCLIANFNEVCFIINEVAAKMSGSFTVSWLVPSTLISDIIVKSARYVDQSFYQEFKITSLTLNGMWLFLSGAEIDAMWSKMRLGDTEFNDQFHIMHKQILCEVDRIGRSIATYKLSSYLMDQQPTLQRDVSVNISQIFLNSDFPISLIDFRMLTIVIELFGSNCLKRVMESYCRFMSIFVNRSTLEQLIDLLPIQSRVPEDFGLEAECKIDIIGEPFKYGLEKLLEFQTKFCSMVNIDKVCFVMGKVGKKI